MSNSKIHGQKLIDKIYEDANKHTTVSKKDIELIVKTCFDTMQSELKKGNDIVIRGFGSFKVVQTKKKKGNNINTHEQIDIMPRYRVKFSMGKNLDNMMKDKTQD